MNKPLSFPDFAVRLSATRDNETTFDLATFNPDLDDNGRDHDFGDAIIEGGHFVGDGSRRDWDPVKVRQIASLIEHAPALFEMVKKMSESDPRAARLVRDITGGDLVYSYEASVAIGG